MKGFFASLLLLISSFISAAQIKDTNQIVKNQVNKMGQAFIAGDYKTFAKYNNPAIVKMMGGKEKMATSMSNIITNMKAKGMSFKGFTFDNPSRIVKSGKELQCTIVQHTSVNTPSGEVLSTSTIIAISADYGYNWTFMDTNNKDIEIIKKILPNLSSAVIITLKQRTL